MTAVWPNHALQRTRPSRRGCNRTPSWAGSLSLGRSDAKAVIRQFSHFAVDGIQFVASAAVASRASAARLGRLA